MPWKPLRPALSVGGNGPPQVVTDSIPKLVSQSTRPHPGKGWASQGGLARSNVGAAPNPAPCPAALCGQ
eukprot:2290498-Alexandrium_andersonii.AAC.1